MIQIGKNFFGNLNYYYRKYILIHNDIKTTDVYATNIIMHLKVYINIESLKILYKLENHIIQGAAHLNVGLVWEKWNGRAFLVKWYLDPKNW